MATTHDGKPYTRSAGQSWRPDASYRTRHLLGNAACLVARHVWQKEREVAPAEPGDEIRASHPAFEGPGNPAEQLVSSLMA